MSVLSRLLPLCAVTALAAAALVAAAVSCGGDGLAKAHAAYDAAVEPLLERESQVRTALAKFNVELQSGNPDLERLEAYVNTQAVPFYDSFAEKVAGLAPAHPGLATAHELLVRYGASRKELARMLQQNLDLFRPGAAQEALGRTSQAANESIEEYKAKLDPAAPVYDPRFTDLNQSMREFEKLLQEFAEGRRTIDELGTAMREKILPAVRELRAGKFAEDETSKALLAAIVRSQEFYEAVTENLPHLDRNAKFTAELKRRVAEGDALLKKFMDELAAVRRRL